MSKITLFYFPLSSCSRKVLFCLYEKNIAFESVIINLPSGEQKTPDFLTRNPRGQVPVLCCDGEYIYDSSVILEFLEEYFPYPALLPKDIVQKAIVRKHTQYADQFFYPAISTILAEFRLPQRQRDLDRINHYLDVFHTMHLPYLSKLINTREGNFLFGNLTLTDIAFAMGLIRLKEVVGSQLTLTPTQLDWMQTIQDLKSYKKLSLLNYDLLTTLKGEKNVAV